MVEKHIKKVLAKKLDEWIKTINDTKLQKMVFKDAIITGGAIVSLINSETPNDFDVYFKTRETTLAVAKYYSDKWNAEAVGKPVVFILTKDYQIETSKLTPTMSKMQQDERIRFFIRSGGVASEKPMVPDYEMAEDNEEDEEPKKEAYRPVFFSSNAVTLSDKIQIVVRFYGDPNVIHETFDFVHTMGHYSLGTNTLVISKEVYEATVNKVLTYTGSKYPIASLFRIRKFIERGWTINAGQILKMAFQVSELILTDIKVLEDQLIGVDSAFFNNLVNQLKEAKDKPGFKLTAEYITSIVDKVF